jgi:uncharacterized protein with GYD domain
MIRLVTRGRLSQNYAKAFVAAPEDREPAVRKLIEAAGGKVINFYFTTGDADFLLISEANDTENIIAASPTLPIWGYGRFSYEHLISTQHQRMGGASAR